MKYGMILLACVFSMFLLAGCGDDDCEEIIDPSCTCPAIFDPVCGCNNVTYGNSCEAECSNITDYTPGECP